MRLFPGATVRRAAMLLLPAGALLAGGCAHFKEWFPSHEDVFTPIEPNVGVAHITGKDTTWTLDGAGYEMTSTRRSILAAAQTALDGAASDFRGYFSDDPPKVRVVAIQAPRRGQRPDTTRLREITASGATPLFIRTAEQERGRYGPGQDFVVVSPVVRAWVNALGARARSDSASGATARPAVPRWLATALPPLVVGNPDPDMVSLQIAQHPDRIIGLRSIFSGDRPVPTEEQTRDSAAREYPFDRDGREQLGRRSGRGPFPMSRGGELAALSGATLWDAEAISVAFFLGAKEGHAFIGQAARTLIGGGTMDEVLASARVVPRDVDALDRAWRDWLAQQRQSEDRASR